MTDTTVGLSTRTRCYEHTIRVDRIIHLDTMTVDAIDDDVADFLIGLPKLIAPLLHIAEDDCDSLTLDEFEEAAASYELRGWVIECTTPTRYKSKSGMVSYSWGDCWLERFYGETYEAALEQAFTWAAKQEPDDA